MESRGTASFASESARALALLGARDDEPAVDGHFDRAGARAALESLEPGASLLVRVAPELAAGRDEAFGPEPAHPFWLRVTRAGPDDVAASVLVPLRAREGDSPLRSAVDAVEVETGEVPCCESAACELTKTRATVFARAGERRFVVGEELAQDGQTARSRAAGLARALAGALGVPVSGVDDCDDGTKEAAAEPLPALALARFAVRREAEGLVVRDHGSDGPRARARRLTLWGAAFATVAAVLVAMLGRSIATGASWTVHVGFGALAALAALTAYTFFGVAAFARRYVADSAPLAWIGRDRVTVAPWVSRTGAVGLRPEGRYGVSIPLREVRGARVVARGEAWSVELDTEHGPMDVVAYVAEPVAKRWCAAVERAMAQVAHPDPKTTGRQRARARAQGKPAPAAS